MERNRIKVEIEDEVDEAYVEDTLGLKGDGDSIKLVRRDSKKRTGFGYSNVKYLETLRK